MRLATVEKSQSFRQVVSLPKPAALAPAMAAKAPVSALRVDAFETNQPVRSRAASAAAVHTVRPGETLTAIARRYGTTVQAIAQANGITNPNFISVGQQLRIPGTSAPAPTTPTTPSPTPVGAGLATNVQDANRVFLNQWGPTAFNSGGHPYGFNDCGPTSGAMVLAQLGLMNPASASQASGAIDRVRDAVLGYDSNYSARMGTSQLAGGLRALGANTQQLSGPVVSAVDGALARGNPVILGGYGVWGAWGADQKGAGNYLNSRDPGGHFVAVLGKTRDGQYLVGDPLVRGGAITVSAEQLQRFYGNNGFGILEVSRP